MQHTLRAPVTCQGIGVHSGDATRVQLVPADPDTGLRLVRADVAGAEAAPVHVDAVADSRLATVLAGPGWRVSTVEHLLAALVATGVDNAEIRVHGAEIPVLDGSATPWMELLSVVGLVSQPAPRRVIVVKQPVEVRSGPRVARLLPADRLELAARIDYPHPRIGAQSLTVPLTAASFATEIAWARTFGFLHEVEAMRAAGFARGGSMENAVVYDQHGVLNPEGARAEDEPVRHKVLDMVGDLALAGRPVRARFESELPGHALSAALLRALFSRPDAYSVEEERDSGP